VFECQSLSGPSEDVAGVWSGPGHAAKLRPPGCPDSCLPVNYLCGG
jgi:hypothetical protein